MVSASFGRTTLSPPRRAARRLFGRRTMAAMLPALYVSHAVAKSAPLELADEGPLDLQGETIEPPPSHLVLPFGGVRPVSLWRRATEPPSRTEEGTVIDIDRLPVIMRENTYFSFASDHDRLRERKTCVTFQIAS